MGEETGFGVDNRSSDTFCHYFTEDTKSQKRGLKVLAPGTQGKICRRTSRRVDGGLDSERS